MEDLGPVLTSSTESPTVPAGTIPITPGAHPASKPWRPRGLGYPASEDKTEAWLVWQAVIHGP